MTKDSRELDHSCGMVCQ